MGHPIHKHMKGFQSRELTDMPIMHDEKGEGRGGHSPTLPNLGSPAKQQGYNARLDESLGMRDGKESTKLQSLKARRDESKGEEKHLGHHAYSGNRSSIQGPANLGSPAKQYGESLAAKRKKAGGKQPAQVQYDADGVASKIEGTGQSR